MMGNHTGKLHQMIRGPGCGPSYGTHLPPVSPTSRGPSLHVPSASPRPGRPTNRHRATPAASYPSLRILPGGFR